MPDIKKNNPTSNIMTEEKKLKDDTKKTTTTHSHIFITIPGNLHTKKNHRERQYSKTKTGKLIQFDAASSSYRAWEQRAKQAAQYVLELANIKTPLENKIKLTVKAYIKGNLPDLDAIHTAVMDALEGLAWKNDKQITQFSDQSCVQQDKNYPRTEIIIEILPKGGSHG